MLDFSCVRTPAHDGDLLIVPEPERMGDLLDTNRKRSNSWDVPVLDGSVKEWRRSSRAQLPGGGETPVVLTGHQPDFIHPGVWAKQAVTHVVADRLGAVALNLVVDQDSPKESAIVVPVDDKRGARVVRIPYAGSVHGQPFELMPAMSADAVRRFAESIREALGEAFDDSSMDSFLQAMTTMTDSREGLSGQILAGRRTIDEEHDVLVHTCRASKAWPAWHGADLILNAARFVRAYNQALGDYRRLMNIKSPSRPIPDLRRDAERVELPLWAYGPDRVRRRVWVQPAPDCIRVFADRDPIGELRVGDLRRTDVASRTISEGLSAPLRPRALTLMLWARVFASDLFIHGIGGAKYDRITDEIIRRYYKVTPPAYACASATLHPEIRKYPVRPNDLREARRRARDVMHNPQRYLGPHPDRQGIESALAETLRLSEDLRREDRRRRAARREAFLRVRALKSDLLGLEPGLADRMRDNVRGIESQLAHNRIAEGREYFVGLYPRRKVAALAAKIHERCA